MKNAKLIQVFEGFLILLALIGTVVMMNAMMGCGFATDAVSENTNVDIINPVAYKYKKEIIGPCTFHVSVDVDMPAGYEHWQENAHQMSAIFGKFERSEYSTWNTLSVSIPCAACATEGIAGMISVLDSKDHLVPWGCGPERPPLNVEVVSATFVDMKGISEKEWSDTPPTTYEKEYAPELMNDPQFCDGEYVLFDLTPACEVLVDAGLMDKE